MRLLCCPSLLEWRFDHSFNARGAILDVERGTLLKLGKAAPQPSSAARTCF
jgi:hypothetical protein